MEIIGNILWQIVNAVLWFFHFEEKLAIILDNRDWPNWQQVPVIVIVNMTIILWEVWIYNWLIRLYNWLIGWLNKHFSWTRRISPVNLEKPKTPRIVLLVTKGKPIGILELAILAFVPLCQKFATFVYTTQRKYFGIKGYWALCLGGAIRVTIMIFAPKESLPYIIGSMLVIRIATWWLDNGYHKVGNKK